MRHKRVRSGRRQRGASTIEWVIVTLGLALAVLATQDFVIEKLREHNDEYTWAMSQPS